MAGPVSFWQLQANEIAGWTFQVTTLSDDFGYDAYLQSRVEGAIVPMWIKPSGKIVFASTAAGEPASQDQVRCYAPTDNDAKARKPTVAINESE